MRFVALVPFFSSEPSVPPSMNRSCGRALCFSTEISPSESGAFLMGDIQDISMECSHRPSLPRLNVISLLCHLQKFNFGANSCEQDEAL